MSKVVVTVPFNGALDGQHYGTRFEKGSELPAESQLAKIALAEKWAEVVPEQKAKKAAAHEGDASDKLGLA